MLFYYSEENIFNREGIDGFELYFENAQSCLWPFNKNNSFPIIEIFLGFGTFIGKTECEKFSVRPLKYFFFRENKKFLFLF